MTEEKIPFDDPLQALRLLASSIQDQMAGFREESMERADVSVELAAEAEKAATDAGSQVEVLKRELDELRSEVKLQHLYKGLTTFWVMWSASLFRFQQASLANEVLVEKINTDHMEALTNLIRIEVGLVNIKNPMERNRILDEASDTVSIFLAGALSRINELGELLSA